MKKKNDEGGSSRPDNVPRLMSAIFSPWPSMQTYLDYHAGKDTPSTRFAFQRGPKWGDPIETIGTRQQFEEDYVRDALSNARQVYDRFGEDLSYNRLDMPDVRQGLPFPTRTLLPDGLGVDELRQMDEMDKAASDKRVAKINRSLSGEQPMDNAALRFWTKQAEDSLKNRKKP